MKKKFILNILFTFQFGLFFSCSNPQVYKKQYNQENILNSSVKAESITYLHEDDFLPPDGKKSFEWKLNLKNSNNEPLKNVKVDFEIISDNNFNFSIKDISSLYGSNSTLFNQRVSTGNIRLAGSVSPLNNLTDQKGFIKTVYKAPHMTNNGEEPYTEKLLAKINGKKISEQTINIGYDNLVELPVVQGGIIKANKISGDYIHPNLVNFLINLGHGVNEANWENPLIITSASKKWGGLFPPHFGHRNGASIDIAPYSEDGKASWCNTNGNFSKNYVRSKTLALIKILKASGATEIYFNDPEAKNFGATPLPNHHHHIHVSWFKGDDVFEPKDNFDIAFILSDTDKNLRLSFNN